MSAKREGGMASETDIAQLLQSAGISIADLQVDGQPETTILRGRVSSEAEKARAEEAVRGAIGDRVTSYLEVQPGTADLPPRPHGTMYTTQPGDTLRKIATRFYGDEMKWHGIRDANRDVLPDPDHLAAGMSLLVPDDPGGVGA